MKNATVMSLTILTVLTACARQEPAAQAPPAAPPAATSPVPLSASTGTIADLGGPAWTLVSFADGEVVPTDIEITLAIGGEQVNGNGGCNRYMGSIKNGDAPGKIAFGPLALTRMACAPPQAEAEDRYTRALQNANGFVILEGRLLITYQDGDAAKTLTYSRG